MKSAVVFIAAFVVATAAATGAKIVMTKASAHTAADSTKADSTKSDSTKSHPDSTKTDTAIVASGQSVTPPTDTTRRAPVAPGDTSSKPSVTVSVAGSPQIPPSVTPVVTAGTKDTVVEASERRIAKVFTSMDPKQAAKVLEHMDDNDVQVILGYVGVKQAAAIMAALDPDRVAKLSKLAMQSSKSTSPQPTKPATPTPAPAAASGGKVK
jgi:hypothetical protein